MIKHKPGFNKEPTRLDIGNKWLESIWGFCDLIIKYITNCRHVHLSRNLEILKNETKATKTWFWLATVSIDHPYDVNEF